METEIVSFVKGKHVETVAQGNENDAPFRVLPRISVRQFSDRPGFESASVDKDEDRISLRVLTGHDIETHLMFGIGEFPFTAEFPVVERTRAYRYAFIAESGVLVAVLLGLSRVKNTLIRYFFRHPETLAYSVRNAAKETISVFFLSDDFSDLRTYAAVSHSSITSIRDTTEKRTSFTSFQFLEAFRYRRGVLCEFLDGEILGLVVGEPQIAVGR